MQSGVSVNLFLQQKTGRRGGNSSCGPRIADAGTIGLNIAFPELTIALTVALPFSQDSLKENEPCEYDPDMDLTTVSFSSTNKFLPIFCF